jgi:hypothetical protein
MRASRWDTGATHPPATALSLIHKRRPRKRGPARLVPRCATLQPCRRAPRGLTRLGLALIVNSGGARAACPMYCGWSATPPPDPCASPFGRTALAHLPLPLNGYSPARHRADRSPPAVSAATERDRERLEPGEVSALCSRFPADDSPAFRAAPPRGTSSTASGPSGHRPLVKRAGQVAAMGIAGSSRPESGSLQRNLTSAS